MRLLSLAFALAACASLQAASPPPALSNGGFEEGLSGWRPFWSRAQGAGAVVLDRSSPHSGAAAARVTHTAQGDWSFEPLSNLPARPGDLFEIEAFLKVEGQGDAVVCASTWDAAQKAVEWSCGARHLRNAPAWTRVRTSFVVPEGIARIQPRLLGHGPATVWVDDYSVTLKTNIFSARAAGLPASLLLSNAFLSASLNTRDLTLSVADARTGRRWTQQPAAPEWAVVRASQISNHLDLACWHAPSGLQMRLTMELDAARPEILVSIAGEGELSAPLRFPAPFVSRAGDRLVIPMNEGISYPAEDRSIDPFRLVAYGGHGICMAFWGVTDGQAGHAAILETPDDASIQIRRLDGLLAVAPEWDPQLGRFGYTRRVRYVFFDQGGHVTIAKRYRAHARETGLFKTLAEKRQFNPDVDLLAGAVNVWNWDMPPEDLVRQMHGAGIDRILWSRGGNPAQIRALNDLNVLTSRYDIYQDVMAPSNFPAMKSLHGDWTTEAWPNDIIRRADGSWQHGWAVQGKDNAWYSCGVLCDLKGPEYARRRIPADLAARPFHCRFIDTTTAAPWNECYNPAHPMTRTDSRVWKMKLLDYVSRDQHLVTGCETGHDAAVPFLHYFEGMLSLGPYRVPDSGRNIQQIWTNDIPARVSQFQLGHAYRLPLWELVYHECVVAQWYWGDYNNKLPALWDKRDLFNLLYATPPMFIFNRSSWQQNKDRFVRSYQNTCPVVRAAAYSEMTRHSVLTADRSVQQTAFANGIEITVNFGAAPWAPPQGAPIAANGFKVTQNGKPFAAETQ